MGPSLIGDGNTRAVSHPYAPVRASMGPSLIGDGNEWARRRYSITSGGASMKGRP